MVPTLPVKSFSRKKIVFASAVYVVWFALGVFVSGVGAAIHVLIGILWIFLFAFIISYATARLGRALRHEGTPLVLSDFARQFFFRVSVVVLSLAVVITTFVVYHNQISPATLPILTISNGIHTIEFQTMSHIATPRFYDEVRGRIADAKARGYVLFYEGVRPGTPESREAFDRALGVRFGSGLYAHMSSLYGLTAQDNEKFLRIGNDFDYNVDVSLDTIMEMYRAKYGTGETARATDTHPADVSEMVRQIDGMLTARERGLIAYVNRSFVNFFMKSEWAQEEMIDASDHEDIMDIILNSRNDLVAKTINESPHDRIFLLYGLLHVNGILDKLRQIDPSYHVVGIGESYPTR